MVTSFSSLVSSQHYAFTVTHACQWFGLQRDAIAFAVTLLTCLGSRFPACEVLDASRHIRCCLALRAAESRYM